MPQLRKNRAFKRWVIDVVIRVVLSLVFAFSAGEYGRTAMHEWQSASGTHLDFARLSHGLSVFAIALYTMMIACIYVVRLQPVNKFAGFWPAIVAILGGFLMIGLTWLKPRTDLAPAIQIAASALIIISNIFAVYILTKLGRSFSILPEGRRLVTAGPYKIIRHPLYVAEGLAMLGTMVLFLSPAAVTLFLVQTALQLGRIHYEERVLRKTFPEYAKYMRTTARLIPGVY